MADPAPASNWTSRLPFKVGYFLELFGFGAYGSGKYGRSDTTRKNWSRTKHTVSALALAAGGLLALFAALSAEDTYTDAIQLRKPEVGVEDEETSYGEKLNTNFDLIDSAFQTVGVSTAALAVEISSRTTRIKPDMTGMIVPMYIYPSSVNSNTDYRRMVDLIKKYHNVPVWIIINPADGAGSVEDGNWTQAIRLLRGAGAKTLGYITIDYGSKSSATITSDIAAWKSLYPDVDGIFVDEADNDTEMIPHHQWVRDQIYDQDFWPAVGNPGSAINESWFQNDVFDYFVIYENSSYPAEVTLNRYTTTGEAKYPYRDRMGLVYNQASLTVSTVRMMRKHLGAVFVTSDNLPNPWDSLPAYLEDLFSLLANPNDATFVVEKTTDTTGSKALGVNVSDPDAITSTLTVRGSVEWGDAPTVATGTAAGLFEAWGLSCGGGATAVSGYLSWGNCSTTFDSAKALTPTKKGLTIFLTDTMKVLLSTGSGKGDFADMDGTDWY